VITTGGLVDGVAMNASQVVPMNVQDQNYSWVGPAAAPIPTWINSNTGVCAPNALYCWRFRMWTQTAPGASGIKVGAYTQNMLGAVVAIWNVDDLTTFTGYRAGLFLPVAYAPGDPSVLTMLIHFSATDPTGVLKYDMAVMRLAY
jgi:hypothetical protein